MLTEFEVRRRVEMIRASRAAPIRKVRLLLKLGKSLDQQTQSLSQAKAQISQTADKRASAALNRMTSRMKLLHNDVRDAAFEVLHPDDQIARMN
ncbi:MAG TPA: hypothetical protein VK934_08305 [Fimbriimonas sp.]|nr:hypothetical protein [Fimbriimonas sp.]